MPGLRRGEGTNVESGRAEAGFRQPVTKRKRHDAFGPGLAEDETEATRWLVFLL